MINNTKILSAALALLFVNQVIVASADPSSDDAALRRIAAGRAVPSGITQAPGAMLPGMSQAQRSMMTARFQAAFLESQAPTTTTTPGAADNGANPGTGGTK